MPDPLTQTVIAAAVRSVCTKFNAYASSSKFDRQWICDAAEPNDLVKKNRKKDTTEGGTTNPPTAANNLYGVVARKAIEQRSEPELATFYLAYSTWDGRVLFRDFCTSDNESSLSFLWYYILANVAVDLGCSRLVWGQQGQVPVFKNGVANVEILHGWLTLHWSLEAMEEYTGNQQPIISTVGTSTSVSDVFASVLKDQSTPEFSLRLAGSDDICHITRLVQGLADYEKEPDSVNIGAEQYRLDGFPKIGDSAPLFYCILLDTNPGGSGTEPYTCGMAFCFIGNNLEAGQFLYLEDLFLEKEHRGKGGGSLVMHALARIAQSLLCSKMVWQALDWNTPALDFYEKIGAKVQPGLRTCRFAGSSLQEFAKVSPECLK